MYFADVLVIMMQDNNDALFSFFFLKQYVIPYLDKLWDLENTRIHQRLHAVAAPW